MLERLVSVFVSNPTLARDFVSFCMKTYPFIARFDDYPYQKPLLYLLSSFKEMHCSLCAVNHARRQITL